MRELNKDTARRAEILGDALAPTSWGGIQNYDYATLSQLELLLKENFADPNDQQNEAPTFLQFVEFMRENPEVTAHGYIVEPHREDYRVTIEGLYLEAEHVTLESKFAFVQFNAEADELETDGDLRSWWD